jgi:hypothetical protein
MAKSASTIVYSAKAPGLASGTFAIGSMSVIVDSGGLKRNPHLLEE